MLIGDRIFITLVSFVFVFFLWIGLLEKYFPLWGCLIVGFIIGLVLIGGRLIQLKKAKLKKDDQLVAPR